MTPRPARISDANVLSWRDVEFEDGGGRGTPGDWLASGCWPDAAHAPQIAEVAGVAYYAQGGVVKPLPLAGLHCFGNDERMLESAGTWPAAWEACDSPFLMLSTLERFVPGVDTRRAAVACAMAALHVSADVDRVGRPFLESMLAGCVPTVDDLLATGGPAFERARFRRHEAEQMTPPDAADAEMFAAASVLFAVTGDSSMAAHDAIRAIQIATWAPRPAGWDVAATPRSNMMRIVRGCVPWHAVLDGLLRLDATESHIGWRNAFIPWGQGSVVVPSDRATPASIACARSYDGNTLVTVSVNAGEVVIRRFDAGPDAPGLWVQWSIISHHEEQHLRNRLWTPQAVEGGSIQWVHANGGPPETTERAWAIEQAWEDIVNEDDLEAPDDGQE